MVLHGTDPIVKATVPLFSKITLSVFFPNAIVRHITHEQCHIWASAHARGYRPISFSCDDYVFVLRITFIRDLEANVIRCCVGAVN